MKIAPKDVAHVASLARLRLSEKDIGLFTTQLSSILEYFQKLQNVDTFGVEPFTHATNLTNVFREDEREASIPREEALKNAPDCEQSYFKVPKVLGS